MKIIVVGCGEVGYMIAKVLCAKKDINITIIDKNPYIFENSVESIDAITITGSGVNEKTLIEAGAKNADLIVSATNADEVNILSCIMAKHLGTKHTIARLRNPDYSMEFNKLWRDLGIDMVINPELQTAREISRLLRYPTASDVSTFVHGRVELVTFKVSEASDFFIGKNVSQIFTDKMRLLLAVIERDNKSLIPHGDLIFNNGDTVHLLGRPSSIMSFLTTLNRMPKSQEVMVIGGGKITYYLAELLNRYTIKTNIKIIEKDMEKCEALEEELSAINRRCLIIHGDGTNEDVLTDEDIGQTDAFICLTDRDEENAIISLYALQVGVKKVIMKVNYIHQNMIRNLGLKLGNIVAPQNIISDIVARYVYGLTGVVGSNIRTMHHIFAGDDGTVEAIEFQVHKKSRCLGIPLRNLSTKKEILIGCIVRDSDIIIPSGETQMKADDNVIIISKNNDIHELDDILADRI